MSITPTLLILYNRPEKTKRLLEELKKIKPKNLYIFCDGPKNTEDKQKIAEIKQLVKGISWTKNVSTRFEKKNLGCKNGVSSAISWFFSKVDAGIILEDDCLPNESFFKYSNELLKKYKDDTRISLIAGTNSGFTVNTDSSYIFSTFSNIWGWASWSDRWNSYKWLKLEGKELLVTANVLDNLKAKNIPDSFIQNTLNSLKGDLDTWDYIWTMSNILNNRVSIIPKVNMISNIGFGEDSTHTKVVTKQANMQRQEMLFPLAHPTHVIANATFDSIKRKRHIKIYAIIEFIIEKLLKTLGK